MKINRTNIGEEIRKKVEEAGMSKAKFAKQLNIARQNIEKSVFQKHSLDTDLLCNICEVLNYNFFSCFETQEKCNLNDYSNNQKIKAKLSIELNGHKEEKTFELNFEGKENKNNELY